jgi:hypothetical protein
MLWEHVLQAGVSDYFKSSGTFVYRRISVYDDSTSDLLCYADQIVTFIASALFHGSVLVHCQRGVSRSATAVGFYLMRKLGMSLDQAMSLMKEKRPKVEPIPAFVRQLEKYEKKCALLVSNEAESFVSESGQKRPAAGPINPALPPSHVKEKRAKTIGPTLPSSMSAGDQEPEKSQNASDSRPETAESSVSIGQRSD